MRKELTWISYTLLSSVLIVYIVFGNSTLDFRFRDTSIILPSWGWTIPVFLLLCFVIFFFRILKEGFISSTRNAVFLLLGFTIIVVLQILKSYFYLLDNYLAHGQLRAVPVGGKAIWYSRNTLPVIVALQIFIGLALVLVIYFWASRNNLKSNGNAHKD
jgi:hypothetical protein